MRLLIVRLSGTAALLLAAAIIAFGTVVTLGHLIAPLASNYHSEAEMALTKAFGQKVEIKRLTGSWKGYGPQLTLQKVIIHNDQTAPLELPEIRISVSLISSLIKGELIARRVTLIAPKLQIKRTPDGKIHIAGIQQQDTTQKEEKALLLPSHLRIQNGQVTYTDQTVYAEPIELADLDLNIRSDDDRHQLDLSTSLSGDEDNRLTTNLDITSDNPSDLSTWDASFHINTSQLPLGQIIEHIPGYPHELPGGSSNISIWGKINRGQMSHLSGSLEIEDLLFDISRKGAGHSPHPLTLKQLDGKFAWTRQNQGWILDIIDLAITDQNQTYPDSKLKLALSEHGLNIGIDQIDLTEAAALILAILPADHGLTEPLKSLSPRGLVQQLRVSIDPNDFTQWSANGQLTDARTLPTKEIPGVERLNTEFWLTPTQGQLAINSHDATVTFIDLFRDPLSFEQLQGSIYWIKDHDAGWRLHSHYLQATTPDIETETRFLVQQPTDGQQPLFMDLQMSYWDGDGSKTSRYLPVGIMGDEVVAWIDRSIGKGRVPYGGVIVRGPLADFPYTDTHNGRFEVFFRAEGLDLDYWPEWPKLSDIHADVRFLNTELDIWLDQANILNSKVISAHGRIQDLVLTSPFELNGVVEGPLADSLTLLSESPLKEDFGPLVADLSGNGNTRLGLDFAIQIDDKGEERLDGKLTFLNSELTLKSWDLTLDTIQGDLTFDLNGIFGNNLQGKMQGIDIFVDVQTSKARPNYSRLSVNGRIPSEKLQQRFSDIDLLSRTSGTSQWQMELDIPHLEAGPKANTFLEVSSNLQGVEIDAPPPLGKSSDSTRPFTLLTQLGPETLQQYNANYDALVDATVLVNKKLPALAGINIGLGGVAAKPPVEGEVEIHGRLDELHIDPWLAEMNATDKAHADLSLKSIDLNLGKVLFKQTELGNTRLNLKRSPHQWTALVQNDQMSGKVLIPSDIENQPLKLELDELKLTVDPADAELDDEQVSPPQHKLDPTQIPALQASIKKLLINNHPFGSVKLVTEKTPTGLTLKQFALKSEQVELSASGYWTKNNTSHHTGLDFDLSTPDTGELLEKLGFTKNLQKAPLELEGDLTWPYSPIDFHRSTLSGEASMRVGKGQFLEVDPGVGRIFGLLNLTALQRRLTLDFSDVFQKGFAFDSIESSFILDSGDAYTNDFAITGPAANIEISGRIGLAAKDIDQQIAVTPKISSTLPLAGTLAGGPAVGAALLLAQKLFGDSLDKVTRIKYSAIGPWDNPEFIQHQAPQANQSNKDQLLGASPLHNTEKEWKLPSNHDDYFETPLESETTTTPNQKESENVTRAADEENAEKKTEKGFFSNFLEKLKPTKPEYPDQTLEGSSQ